MMISVNVERSTKIGPGCVDLTSSTMKFIHLVLFE